MKKLLVLALVLCMATMASAALKISVNGVVDGTAILHPSETATLAISTDAPMGFGLGDWNGAALVANISQATMTTGVSMYPNEPGIVLYADALVDLQFPFPGSDAGQAGPGYTLNFTGANILAGTIIDQIILHCEGAGQTVVTLWGSNDYLEFTNLGSVTITQLVPEPMTMGLLGLGGLFLRRRSK